MDGSRVRCLLDAATDAGLTLARLPRLTEFKSGIGDTTKVRPVAIEDLLGRAQKPLDRISMASLIKGKKILITGAGGSIGSELVRQICDFEPAELTLLDSSEYNLYSIDMEISVSHPNIARQTLISDVRDHKAIYRLFSDVRPELVFPQPL